MLYLLLSAIALAPLVCLQQTGEHQKVPVQTVCSESSCYTLQEDNRKFNMARKMCSSADGNAMTVKSAEAAAVISLLLQNSNIQGTQFWIGLELRLHKCPNNNSELMGYQWVDGESDTGYSNWKSVSTECGVRCVTVSRDLSWEDRPCNMKADGILCEFEYYEGMCEGLGLVGGSLTYRTPYGGESSDLSKAPPGTIASLSPSGLTLECLSKEMVAWGWNSQTPGPWECQEDNDGYSKCTCRPEYQLKVEKQDCLVTEYCLGRSCHSLCVDQSGAVYCMCPDGYELDQDIRRCNEIDECLREPCEGDQICKNTPGSFSCDCPTGYRKIQPNKCQEINECNKKPRPCLHQCGNTPGSFICTCLPGFQTDPEDFTKCVFYCNTPECEPYEYSDMSACPVGYILDKTTCVDINECMSTMCEYDCTNTYGSYKCSCPLGFQLKEDGNTCENGSTDVPETTERVPTPISPTNHTLIAGAHITPGALLGIIFSIVVVVLVLACLGHQLLKKHGKSQASTKHKPPKDEQDVNLSQVLSAGDVQQKQGQFADEKAELTC